MALENYDDLKETIVKWLERPSMSPIIPDLIRAAEVRIADDVRLRSMEAEVYATIYEGTKIVPLFSGDTIVGFKGPVWVTDQQGYKTPMFERSEDYVNEHYPSDCVSRPKDFYLHGSDIVLACNSDAQYQIKGVYYRRFELSDYRPTNWVLANYPMAYVYATMIEAMLFLEADPRRFEAMYLEQLGRMRRRENREKTGAGPRRWRQMSIDGRQGA